MRASKLSKSYLFDRVGSFSILAVSSGVPYTTRDSWYQSQSMSGYGRGQVAPQARCIAIRYCLVLTKNKDFEQFERQNAYTYLLSLTFQAKQCELVLTYYKVAIVEPSRTDSSTVA